MIWSDDCAAQFRSKFVIYIVSRIFLERALSWFYNKRHDKGPIDGIGGTTKNVIFSKGKSGHIIGKTPSEFADAAKKFVRSISTIYMPGSCMILESEVIENAPFIKGTLKIHKIVRMFENGQPHLKFFELACDD